MTERPERRIGAAGRTVPLARRARRLAVLLAAAALVTGVLALVTWRQEADLRNADALVRTTATVTDVDDNRRRADILHVDFTAGGVAQRAGIPYDGPAGAGEQVTVAYVSEAPSRVRTLDDWDPAYGTWTVYALMTAVTGVIVGCFGLVSRWRANRWETDDASGELPVDELGRRVVRGSPSTGWLLGLSGLTVVGACVYGLVRTDDDQVGFAIGIGLSALLTAAAVAGVHRYSGRDGVWVTDTSLVARRRGRLRSWPWSQVHELGVVVERGTATVPAARIADGLDDGIDADGWITLARPLWGPFAAHTWAARFRRLADDRGLPFTEGLTNDDLADTPLNTYVRKRSLRRAGVSGRTSGT